MRCLTVQLSNPTVEWGCANAAMVTNYYVGLRLS